MTEAQKKALKELLTKALGSAGGRLKTKEAIAILRKVPGFFSDEGYAKAKEAYEERLFQSVLRSVEEEGKQVWHHVQHEDKEGNVTHEYVQLPLLTLEEKRDVGQYRVNMIVRHLKVLKDVAMECRAAHHTKLPVQLSLIEREIDELRPLVKGVRPKAERAERSEKRKERQKEVELNA
jgi:hypothetical protein